MRNSFMTQLPLIVGFGGYNSGGRASFHQSYRRIIFESLSKEEQDKTIAGIACLMGLVTFENGAYLDDRNALDLSQVAEKHRDAVLQGTLIRKIEGNHFDVDAVQAYSKMDLDTDSDIKFTVRTRKLPNPVPENWQVTDNGDKTSDVVISNGMQASVDTYRVNEVQGAGQLPTGFEPAEQYNSRFHPRGLQLAVLAASDALNSVGVEWQEILDQVDPDQVAVYATSAMGQNDEFGYGGMLQARLRSGLRQGVDDIKSGRRRVVVCGSAEAPLQTEIIEGYSSMGALATVEKLAKLDGVSEQDVDFRRSSRPFSDNCGFTLGESAQYVVLMDDELEESIRQRSYVQAHGSSTPQNRVTESEVLDKVAAAFDIEHWPITSIKAYYGHPTGPASGDQLAGALGSFETGVLQGIKTITSVAEDVLDDRLDILLQDKKAEMDVCFLNTKGFGGNNATASVLSAKVAKQMLIKRYGESAYDGYTARNQSVVSKQQVYEQQADHGQLNVIYNFGEGIIDDHQIEINADSLTLPGRKNSVNLDLDNPFSDMV